jgi:serpin B
MLKYISVYILIFVAFSCTKDSGNSNVANPDKALLHKAVIGFGFDLLKENIEENKNVLISPLSVHTALGMTVNGASKSTFEEMQKVLRIADVDVNVVNETYRNYLEELSDRNSPLKMSNAVFSDPKRVLIEDSYLNLVKEKYLVDHKELDFSNQEIALESINTWANDKTKGRIPKVLEAIEDDEILFLINALYFTSNWQLGFVTELTTLTDFYNINGTVSKVDMMFADEMRKFYIDDDVSAVDLPVKNEKYAMTFVLPNKKSVVDFINEQSVDALNSWYENLIAEKLSINRLELYLPKFQISTKLKLNEALENMGMPTAFKSGHADFTKMGTSPLGKLFISRVLHDAFIKIDEKGIEGAAITTVGIAADSLPPRISFDKPFLFILRDTATNMPVFMGVIQVL